MVQLIQVVMTKFWIMFDLYITIQVIIQYIENTSQIKMSQFFKEQPSGETCIHQIYNIIKELYQTWNNIFLSANISFEATAKKTFSICFNIFMNFLILIRALAMIFVFLFYTLWSQNHFINFVRYKNYGNLQNFIFFKVLVTWKNNNKKSITLLNLGGKT